MHPKYDRRAPPRSEWIHNQTVASVTEHRVTPVAVARELRLHLDREGRFETARFKDHTYIVARCQGAGRPVPVRAVNRRAVSPGVPVPISPSPGHWRRGRLNRPETHHAICQPPSARAEPGTPLRERETGRVSSGLVRTRIDGVSLAGDGGGLRRLIRRNVTSWTSAFTRTAPPGDGRRTPCRP